MGGATVLQAVTRSRLAGSVRGVILDSPVVDWVTALHYQGVANHLPLPLRLATMRMLTQRWARIFTGPVGADRPRAARPRAPGERAQHADPAAAQ